MFKFFPLPNTVTRLSPCTSVSPPPQFHQRSTLIYIYKLLFPGGTGGFLDPFKNDLSEIGQLWIEKYSHFSDFELLTI